MFGFVDLDVPPVLVGGLSWGSRAPPRAVCRRNSGSGVGQPGAAKQENTRPKLAPAFFCWPLEFPSICETTSSLTPLKHLFEDLLC